MVFSRLLVENDSTQSHTIFLDLVEAVDVKVGRNFRGLLSCLQPHRLLVLLSSSQWDFRSFSIWTDSQRRSSYRS